MFTNISCHFSTETTKFNLKKKNGFLNFSTKFQINQHPLLDFEVNNLLIRLVIKLSITTSKISVQF